MPVEYAYICHRLLGDPTAMLAKILAIAVGSGSFILFMAAFFFPEVYRKGDFIWSGVGIFYAIVLWFCAGQATGAELLGETASVVLIWSLGGQLLVLRRQRTPSDQQTPTEAIAPPITPPDEPTPAPENADRDQEETAPKADRDDGGELPAENESSDLESTAEPTTEPAAEPTIEPAAEATTEPVTEATTEPATEPAAEPTTEPTQTSQPNGILGSIGAFFGRTANSSNVSAEAPAASPGDDSDPLEDWDEDEFADNSEDSEDSTEIEANAAEASDSVAEADELPVDSETPIATDDESLSADSETPIATEADIQTANADEVSPAAESPADSDSAEDMEPDAATIEEEPTSPESESGETDQASIATEIPPEEPEMKNEAQS